MATLPDTHFARAGTLSEVTRLIREYVALDVSPYGPAEVTAAAYSGYPRTFARQYVARVAQSTGGRGVHRSVPGMPESLDFHVDFYELLGRTDDEVLDAISRAEDSCLEAYSAWRHDLFSDYGFQDRCEAVDITEYSMGATDHYGREFMDTRYNDRLWRLRSLVRVRLA